jgi:hypothetical protein
MVLNMTCFSPGKGGDAIIVLRDVPAISNGAHGQCGKSALRYSPGAGIAWRPGPPPVDADDVDR